MSIVLQGSTSGSVTLQEPAVAGTTVLDLPAVSGTVLTTGSSGQSIPKAALPTGSVLQVVSTTKTDTFSTTSTSFTDITGLSVSITPTSASSKILVFYSFQITFVGAVTGSFSRLMRNSTAIGIGDADGSRSRATLAAYAGDSAGINGSGVHSTNFLDSPATTSATTYKVQMFTQSGTSYINRTVGDADVSATPRNAATITVMEIAA